MKFPFKRRLARGRTHGRKREMNRTERRYAAELSAQMLAGEIIQWWREPFSMRLTDTDGLTTWTPDFMVLYPDGTLEMVDVKGSMGWESAQRAKIKVAADRYFPFRFVGMQEVAKKHGGGWKREVFAWSDETETAKENA